MFDFECYWLLLAVNTPTAIDRRASVDGWQSCSYGLFLLHILLTYNSHPVVHGWNGTICWILVLLCIVCNGHSSLMFYRYFWLLFPRCLYPHLHGIWWSSTCVSTENLTDLLLCHIYRVAQNIWHNYFCTPHLYQILTNLWKKICNNTITKNTTTLEVCRYNTLWNVKCRKSKWKTRRILLQHILRN